MNDDDLIEFEHDEYPIMAGNMISTCCGASPLGEIDRDCGICSDCRDHATFEVNNTEEEND